MTRLDSHWWIILLLVCVPLKLAAQQQASIGVVVSIEPCVPVAEQTVRRLIALELRASLPAASLDGGNSAARIELSCQESLVVVQVHDMVTGKSVTRRIDAGGMPEQGRERLVALAAVELLIASWAELATMASPHSLGVDAKASAQVRRKARAVASQHLPQTPWQDAVMAYGLLSREKHGFAGGAGLRWIRDHEAWTGFSLSTAVDTAQVSVPLGTVAVRSAQLSAAVHSHKSLQRLRLRAGLGVRLGVVSMVGRPADAASTSADSSVGFTFGPMLHIDVEHRLGPLVATLSLEPGYHVLGVGGLVDQVREVGVQGPWLVTTLGLGARW